MQPMNTITQTKYNHAESSCDIDPNTLDYGVMVFECPDCNKTYNVSDGHQMFCPKYKYIRNKQLVLSDGCGFHGLFNVIAYNFKKENK